MAEDQARVWVRVVEAVDTAPVVEERLERARESEVKLRTHHATLCRWAILGDKKRGAIDHKMFRGGERKGRRAFGRSIHSRGPDLVLTMMLQHGKVAGRRNSPKNSGSTAPARDTPQRQHRLSGS